MNTPPSMAEPNGVADVRVRRRGGAAGHHHGRGHKRALHREGLVGQLLDPLLKAAAACRPVLTLVDAARAEASVLILGIRPRPGLPAAW